MCGTMNSNSSGISPAFSWPAICAVVSKWPSGTSLKPRSGPASRFIADGEDSAAEQECGGEFLRRDL